MIYLTLGSAVTGGVANGEAAPVSSILQSWTLSQSRDKQDATCMSDASKSYVVGLPDSSGSFGGLIDFAAANFSNILDGNDRKLYLYPDAVNHPTMYWYGYVTLDGSFSGGVNDLIKCDVTFAATGVGIRSTGTF